MRIRLYLDEDVPSSLEQALINRGVDVVTTVGAGNRANSDEAQLIFSTSRQRVIITHNKKDFILLHNEYVKARKTHSGIILSDQLPVGTMLKRVMKLWFSLSPEDMKNRLEFLSNWK